MVNLVYINDSYGIKKEVRKMKNTLMFDSFGAYEKWVENFDDCFEYEEIPTAIYDGFKLSADMFIYCKSWKTALKQFEKAFNNVNSEVKFWVALMKESAENGYFKDALKPAWKCTEEEKREFYKGGNYAYGIEAIDDNCWYIYLIISGVYAGLN